MKYKIKFIGPWQPNTTISTRCPNPKSTCDTGLYSRKGGFTWPGSVLTAVCTFAATHASANVSIAAWKSIVHLSGLSTKNVLKIKLQYGTTKQIKMLKKVNFPSSNSWMFMDKYVKSKYHDCTLTLQGNVRHESPVSNIIVNNESLTMARYTQVFS